MEIIDKIKIVKDTLLSNISDDFEFDTYYIKGSFTELMINVLARKYGFNRQGPVERNKEDLFLLIDHIFNRSVKENIEIQIHREQYPINFTHQEVKGVYGIYRYNKNEPKGVIKFYFKYKNLCE
jgi:hypothetical protein|nr:MAG TPA: hypothetical protein [Caudoviricetes sp.]